MEVTELIKNIQELTNEVRKYILDTPHFLIYWITNREVRDFIREYPDDYEDRFDIQIEDLNVSTSVKIIFHDHPDDIESITRYCILPTFRESVKAKWMEWENKVDEYRISELNKALEYYKKKVTETENELKKLEK